jgi:hypothetical protein
MNRARRIFDLVRNRLLRKGQIAYVDPLRAGRHPFQIYLLALSVVSGAPILFGSIGAGSIERELPFWLAFCWGLALFGGSGLALFGSFWQGGYVNALTMERIGLAIVGSAAVVYSITIMVAAGSSSPPSRIVPAAIVLAYGGACLSRARDIGRIMRAAIADLKTNGEASNGA